VKTWMKVIAGILAVLVLVVGGALGWAFSTANAKIAAGKYPEIRGKDLPVPWPLTDAEVQALREERALTAVAPPDPANAPGTPADPSTAPADPLAGVDLQAIAMERALARGQHLLDARVGCNDCHAKDYSGNVLIDVPPMGRWVCPNISPGGVTKGFEPADWDRVIRHGVGHDDRGLTMPSRDFSKLSDQEVSDIIAVVSQTPPVTKEQPPIRLGPIYALLIASGQIPIDAENIDHAAALPATPPASEPTVEFGQHLAQVCTGCHMADFSGGKIAGGDPAWPPSRNLTPDPTGLQAWTVDDFKQALREGKSKDGLALDPAMPVPMTKNMTDAEIEALWAYLRTVPAKPWGGKKG
jgi:cytochrome c553